MEALESVLTVATFADEGVSGTWKVTSDDLYESSARYKDFFMLTEEQVSEKTKSNVVYKVKDYDLVGPPDFHEDRRFDKLRDSSDHPYLSIEINFEEAGSAEEKR